MQNVEIKKGDTVVTECGVVAIVTSVFPSGYCTLVSEESGHDLWNVSRNRCGWFPSQLTKIEDTKDSKKELVKMDAEKALKLLESTPEGADAKIEINDGAICVGTRKACIDHLKKNIKLIDDEISIWFESINEILSASNEKTKAKEERAIKKIINELNQACCLIDKSLEMIATRVKASAHSRPYSITIQYNRVNHMAEYLADQIAELAYIELRKYKNLDESQVLIETLENE